MTFTSIHLDHNEAKTILKTAFEKGKKATSLSSPFKNEITKVITGNHLTYRYILITNLLAKATDERINGLALQAGADFKGAFDSRSLCHKVIVPFERENLNGKLGRSNEPYLNKPARHKALADDNAVRKGNDKILLDTCIRILSKSSKKDAFDGLVDAIQIILQLTSINENIVCDEHDVSAHEKLLYFSRLLLDDSNDGENCALISGIGFYCLSLAFSSNLEIKVHPVNQSGASSKEILDIDVYCKNKLLYTAEIKDKAYTNHDVDHAANKVKNAGYDSMFFIVGPKATTKLTKDEVSLIGRNSGVRITVIPVYDFLEMSLGLCVGGVTTVGVWETIAKISITARLKQITTQAIERAAKDSDLILDKMNKA